MTMDKEQSVRPEGPGPVDGAHQARLDQGSAVPGGADGASGRSSMPVPAKSKAPIAQDTQELPATAGPGGPFGLDELDDDWDDEEIDRNRHFDAKHRARNRRITGVLALVAALGVGFAGGVFYQKHSSSSSSSTATGATPDFAALRAAFAGGSSGSGGTSGAARFAGGAGGFAGAFGGANSVVGTVSAVADGTLYVSEGTSSALVKVVTSPTSTVSVPSTGSVSDVQPGDSVVISGAKQKDGSYMAATITDRGASSTGSAGASGASGAGALGAQG